jgi:hypothetical protein
MKRIDQLQNLPIYRKAEDIFRLVNGLLETIPVDDDYLNATKHMMLEDCNIISAKIAGAEGGDEYTIRMQNAAIIREYAMHLYVQVGSLRFHESFKDKDFVILIRKEIDEFRLLFIDWVAGFDTNNYFWDDWELFNPPGAIRPDPDAYQDPINLDDFFDNFDKWYSLGLLFGRCIKYDKQKFGICFHPILLSKLLYLRSPTINELKTYKIDYIQNLLKILNFNK